MCANKSIQRIVPKTVILWYRHLGEKHSLVALRSLQSQEQHTEQADCKKNDQRKPVNTLRVKHSHPVTAHHKNTKIPPSLRPKIWSFAFGKCRTSKKPSCEERGPLDMAGQVTARWLVHLVHLDLVNLFNHLTI